MTKPDIHFCHWPRSRAAVAHALLEELDADYETHLVNIETGEQNQPEFLAINPMAKVPAIVHDGAVAGGRCGLAAPGVTRYNAAPRARCCFVSRPLSGDLVAPDRFACA